MTKLRFNYGCMASGKSMELIKVVTNYNKTGRDCLVLVPTVDTRSGGQVKSRLGESLSATSFTPDDNLEELVYDAILRQTSTTVRDYGLACVVVDEAQFLTEAQVKQLAQVVDTYHLPVIAFGLLRTFQNTLFEGSKALAEYADELNEIKTVCAYCNHKACMNMLIDRAGNRVADGDTYHIGDADFVPVCRKHYNSTPIAVLF